MRGMITGVALLVLLAGPALAQSGTGTGASGRATGATGAASNRNGATEAPVGHRQPRATDVPNATADDPSRLNADDAALDRRIKSICRGC